MRETREQCTESIRPANRFAKQNFHREFESSGSIQLARRDETRRNCVRIITPSYPGVQPIDGKRRFSISNGPWRPRLRAVSRVAAVKFPRSSGGTRVAVDRNERCAWSKGEWRRESMNPRFLHLRTLPSLASLRASPPPLFPREMETRKGGRAPPSCVSQARIRARIFLSWKILRNRWWDHRRPNDYEIYRLLFLIISSFEIEVSRLRRGKGEEGWWRD